MSVFRSLVGANLPLTSRSPAVRDAGPRSRLVEARLLEHFSTVVEVPDGVEKLRGLVLHLAIQGQLLEERPLLAVETPATVGVSVPFGLPAGWMWRRVDEVGALKLGRQRSPKNHFGPYMRPYLRVANVFEGRIDISDVLQMNFDPQEAQRFLLEPSDILLNEGQSYELVGRPAIYRGEMPGACFQNTLIRFRPSVEVLPEFALIVFRAYMRTGRFRREAQQTTNIAHLSLGRLAEIEFPLPPMAEQKRIVAKVDQLMALCDDLDARQAKKRETGARLTKAALDALSTAKKPDEFDHAWRRVVGNFELVIDEADKVAPVRRAILDVALRGGLSATAGAGEPAEVLLNRLRAERRSARGAVSEASEPQCPPFAVPTGWRWVRLDELWLSVTDGDHQPPPKSESGVAFLTIGNVSSGKIDFTSSRFVSEEYFRGLDPLRVPGRGDLLYTVVGSFGIPILVDTDRPFCVQRHIAIMKPLPSTNVSFMLLLMRSALVFGQAKAGVTGIAQPTVGLGVLRKFVVPLPPAAEQTRIVAKVEHLMKLCDELEARLLRAEDLPRKLVEALVQELVA